MKYVIWLCIAAMAFMSHRMPVPYKEPWKLMLKQEGKRDVEIFSLPLDITKPDAVQMSIDNIRVTVTLQPEKGSLVFNVTGSVDTGTARFYFALTKKYADEMPYNFNGEIKTPEIYRQSPHDVNAWIVNDIAMQPIPVVALKKDGLFEVALNGSPALYDNFTSQAFYPGKKTVELCSGDNGTTPGIHPDTSGKEKRSYNTEKTQVLSPGKIIARYHLVGPGKPHSFEGLVFTCRQSSLKGLRKEINQRAAVHFSNNKYTDYFGALSFTTTYMNLRTNETGKSKYWVVPSVEYANTQYCRDAFWISMILPPDMSAECLKNELDSVNHYAEYALCTILWAYRLHRQKCEVDLERVQHYVDAVEKHAADSYFYSYDENDGRLDFQYWGDLIAFDKNDVVAYNQGLFTLALMAARDMGLRIKTDPERALRHYQDFYQPAGFYAISKKKNNLTGPDPVLPDLLSQLYFSRSLLPDDRVKNHYSLLVKRLKTSYGFKVIAQQTGAYLTSAQYDVPGYVSQANKEQVADGQYFRGGSFFLYDNLFLIDAYLHGIREAEDLLIWRTALDFSAGSTTYECLNTITGEPWKPNMGWNVAVYSIWGQLNDQGRAGGRLFHYIDSLCGH